MNSLLKKQQGARLTPVESALRTQRKWRRLGIAVVGLVAIYFLVFQVTYPTRYWTDQNHFKYGSIGSEPANGLPFWILKAIELMYADRLDGRGLGAFGFITEGEKALPIGFSERRVQGVSRVWFNCAGCHTGTYRDSADATRQTVLGAPANNLKLYEFIQFLRTAPLDNRFNADVIIEHIKKAGERLNFIERLIYRHIIVRRVRQALLDLGEQLAFLERQHPWGPGRVDTFNPYKAIQFNFPMDAASLPDYQLNGASDYPSIWQQRPREGMYLHWDGNNPSIDERNLSAALGAGVTPVSVDHDAIERVKDWLLDLPAPVYPKLDSLDEGKLERGSVLYADYCAACHGDRADDGYSYDTDRYPHLGQVVDIAKINTDRGRLDSYTQSFAGTQNLLYAGGKYRFSKFRKTNGYANHPLDGIWMRSPYLHNGSVPTLRDLLEPAAKRPQAFYRGYDVMDWEKVGYVSTVPNESGVDFMRYDTALTGNSNAGHEGPAYGTHLSDAEKDALVEYMKTF